jgi:hypothetical protein
MDFFLFLLWNIPLSPNLVAVLQYRICHETGPSEGSETVRWSRDLRMSRHSQ